MTRIFCLLVGIDGYYHPSHNLKGCVNDINAISAYLKSSFSKEKLSIKILTNNEVTREYIISAFNHFSRAKKVISVSFISLVTGSPIYCLLLASGFC